MGKFLDISSQKFGKLTAIKIHHKTDKHIYWLFRCECGKQKIIPAYYAKSGDSLSCGCVQRERARFLKRSHGLLFYDQNQRLHRIWSGMKTRCYNKKSKNYNDYGGRGIVVCEEWKYSFKIFYDWAISHGYKRNLSLDRIDNDGLYEPSNCKWSNRIQQNRNSRQNIFVTFKGIKILLIELAENLKIPYHILYKRYYRSKDKNIEKIIEDITNDYSD